MRNPYVLSAELDLANRNNDGVISLDKIDGFRENLDANLRSLGKNTLWVDSGTLRSGLENIALKSSLPIISLDDRYIRNAASFIGISRGVDSNLNDVSYVPRVGYPSINEQLSAIPSLGKEIIVVDDVLFSGEMIRWLADSLKSRGVTIRALLCGVAIQEGISKLLSKDIDVEAVQSFVEVEDEICERDFAVVPGSGRRIENRETNSLYFDPTYGRPSQWASIPQDTAEDFAYNTYENAARLLPSALPMSSVGNFYGLTGTTAVEAIKKAVSRIGSALPISKVY